MELSTLDWVLIAGYLVLTFSIGIAVSGKASTDTESYFLAGRTLPWWWAGTSVAATTFAADTPLAVTGIIANRGLSGNWFWLSWMGLHVAIIFFFAKNWRKSEVLTDAEIINLRYSGPEAGYLRTFKAALYGIVFNCIVLGWVLRAMVKIVTPFFHWEQWLPGPIAFVESFWPVDFVLGSPSEVLTVFGLLALVAVYSSAGGIRGVIFTDLFQLGIALLGSYWFAMAVLDEVGGPAGLYEGMGQLYGKDHTFMDLFPRMDVGWLASLKISATVFGAYLLVQSFANNPADGGGYLMQRLGTCKNENHAKGAAFLFVLIQYVIRVWPWFIVGLGALVLIPLGQEGEVYQGMAAAVAQDRESAYPVLMGLLLGPGARGLMMVGLLAAFMSTIDTHINWGSSYIVNDFFNRLYPTASMKAQVRVARLAVLFFALLAVVVASQIKSIETAWQWIAALGAGLAAPTILRWFWWRINAWSEIAAMIVGPGTAGLLMLTDINYETQLVLTALAGLVATLLGAFLGRTTEEQKLMTFVEKISPLGCWPQAGDKRSRKEMLTAAAAMVVLMLGLVVVLKGGQLMMTLNYLLGCLVMVVGLAITFFSFYVEKRLGFLIRE